MCSRRARLGGSPSALAALLAASALGCHDVSSQGVLRLAQPQSLYSLDPDHAADAASRAILCNIYEGLVELDREMVVQPALAVSWNVPDDHTWEFELRRGVKFHDGRTLTAEDVKFSFERVGGSQKPELAGDLAGVDVVDAQHVRLRTTHPDPLLLNRLTQFLVMPSGSEPDARPVGTGPYRVLRRGPPLELEAFAEYWRGRPSIPRVSFTAVPDAGVADVLARRGVDVYRQLPAASLGRLGGLPEYRAVGRPGVAVTYLWINCEPTRDGAKNPFADARVRRAVSGALDRGEIVKRLGGRDVPSHQLLPKGVFGFIPATKPAPLAPERSRELLREAGWRDGFETPLAHAAVESQRTLAGVVRDMLAPVGIRVVPEERTWLQILEGRRDQRLGFFALSWTFDDGDAWTFLMASLHSRRGPGDLRSTNPGYSNPDLDRLIEESQEAPNAKRVLERYGAVLRLALDEAPIIPLYQHYDLYAVSGRAVFEPRLDGKLLAREMRLTP